MDGKGTNGIFLLLDINSIQFQLISMVHWDFLIFVLDKINAYWKKNLDIC